MKFTVNLREHTDSARVEKVVSDMTREEWLQSLKENDKVRMVGCQGEDLGVGIVEGMFDNVIRVCDGKWRYTYNYKRDTGKRDNYRIIPITEEATNINQDFYDNERRVYSLRSKIFEKLTPEILTALEDVFAQAEERSAVAI